MNHVSHNKGRTLPPEPLTRDEVHALLDSCSREPTGRRDRALIAVLWRGQLRISEALALRPCDYDPQACTLRVLRGKGRKPRIAIIDRQTCDAIDVWMGVRKSLGIAGHAPLFCTLSSSRDGSLVPGCPIQAHQVRAMLPRRARKAGIAKRVHAHGLRHTGASELAQEGVPLRDIQLQLGHSSAQTTDRYLHSLVPEEDRVRRLSQRQW